MPGLARLSITETVKSDVGYKVFIFNTIIYIILIIYSFVQLGSNILNKNIPKGIDITFNLLGMLAGPLSYIFLWYYEKRFFRIQDKT